MSSEATEAQYQRMVALIDAYPPFVDTAAAFARSLYTKEDSNRAWWGASYDNVPRSTHVVPSPVRRLDEIMPNVRAAVLEQQRQSLNPENVVSYDLNDVFALSVCTDNQALLWSLDKGIEAGQHKSIERDIYAASTDLVVSRKNTVSSTNPWPVATLDNPVTSAAIAALSGIRPNIKRLTGSYPRDFLRCVFDPVSMCWNEGPNASAHVRFHAVVSSAIVISTLKETLKYSLAKKGRKKEGEVRVRAPETYAYDRAPLPVGPLIRHVSPMARPYRCLATVTRKDNELNATMVMLDLKNPTSETLDGASKYIPGSDITACASIKKKAVFNEDRPCTFVLEYRLEEDLIRVEHSTVLSAGSQQTPHVLFSGLDLCAASFIRITAYVQGESTRMGFSLHVYYAGDAELNREDVFQKAIQVARAVKTLIVQGPSQKRTAKPALKASLKSYQETASRPVQENVLRPVQPPVPDDDDEPARPPKRPLPPPEDDNDDMGVDIDVRQPERPLWSPANEDTIQRFVSKGLWKEAVDAACDAWYMTLPREADAFLPYWQRLAEWIDVYSAVTTAFIHTGSDYVQALVRAYRRRRPELEAFKGIWDSFSGPPELFPEDETIESMARSVVDAATGQSVQAVSSSEAWLDHAMAIEMGLNNDPYFGAEPLDVATMLDLSPPAPESDDYELLVPLSPYPSTLPLTPM